jgi:hypothetical protein
VNCWLIQDSVFFLGALLLYVLDKYESWPGHGLDVCFVLVSIGVLVLDVKFLPDSMGDTGRVGQFPN